MTARPTTIDEYLAPFGKEQRAALEKLRKDIKTAAPKAEECISYDIPTFRLDGYMLVSFGGWASHCAFYPGAFSIEAHKDELKPYSISKGTIRFSADSPLPTTLVRKLVKSRIAHNARKRTLSAGAGRRRR
ncbi:MAG: hypothetical protein QOJ64_4270 [Acidobacteriota bacterium]|jgi:uncharacterized protein YdhG (YjbR/CyaY superfamily)|nr:hypothetical protein [Acidobacteriota bacterium]